MNNSTNPLVIQEFNIRTTDRSRKDINYWRQALAAAEYIHRPNRNQLIDLYEDIVLDGHLYGIMSKRIDAVLNKEIFFERKGKRVHSMNGLLHSLFFRQVVRTIMETLFWGVSGMEFIPGSEPRLEHIPRKHIQLHKQVLSYEPGGQEGIAYTSLAQVWVLGEPRELGLLLRCAPYCLYKRGGLADWAEYIELFGQPVRIIKYDTYDETTKAELRKVLEDSGSSLSMMIPRQAEFEIKDGKQSNSDGDLQLSFLKMLNDELSVIVLGNTETTSSSRTTGYAQSKIHMEQQYEITKSDIAYVTAMLNSAKCKSILQLYGYEVQDGYFEFAKDTDTDHLSQRIAIDMQVAQHIKIPDAYWYDTYGISSAAE